MLPTGHLRRLTELVAGYRATLGAWPQGVRIGPHALRDIALNVGAGGLEVLASKFAICSWFRHDLVAFGSEGEYDPNLATADDAHMFASLYSRQAREWLGVRPNRPPGPPFSYDFHTVRRAAAPVVETVAWYSVIYEEPATRLDLPAITLATLTPFLTGSDFKMLIHNFEPKITAAGGVVAYGDRGSFDLNARPDNLGFWADMPGAMSEARTRLRLGDLYR